jgi:hypothetical protein
LQKGGNFSARWLGGSEKRKSKSKKGVAGDANKMDFAIAGLFMAN